MTDQQSKGPGPDLIGGFQRWALKSGARGVGRELGDQVRSAFGLGGGPQHDVWNTATSEPPPGESAECAWCPVCRAARLLRESGPGIASQVAAASGTLGSLLQEAVAAAEAALASAGRPPGAEPARAEPMWAQSPQSPLAEPEEGELPHGGATGDGAGERSAG